MTPNPNDDKTETKQKKGLSKNKVSQGEEAGLERDSVRYLPAVKAGDKLRTEL